MTLAGPVRVFVSAGEPSGDLHGAGVVAALRRRLPGVEIDAFGGPAMAAEGAAVAYHMEQYSALGLVEVVHSIPAHYRLLRTLRRRFRSRRYDLVLLIDYPGFNVRLARDAHQAGSRVLYFIPPALWAWRPGRARHLRGVADRVAVPLPFEERFLRGLGIPAEFVGHPIVDRAAHAPSREEARRQLEIPAEARVLAIFPGSRAQEVRNHWRHFRDAALALLDEGACDRVIMASTPVGEYPDPGAIRPVDGNSLAVLAAADAVLAKSGTTTLEAALTDTPMVVAYRTNPLTYRLARMLVRVRWISLVNLVAEIEVVPELHQQEVNAQRLRDELRPLLDPAHPKTVAQHAGLELVRQRLGPPGATERVAAMAAELLGQ